LIFGKDNITSGASSDLANATRLIIRLLKQNGMGEHLIHYASSFIDESPSYHESSSVEEEAVIFIHQAKELAEQTLQKEKKLLLVLSQHLAEHSKLLKVELEEIIKENAVTKIPNLSNSRFYRDKLKSQLETNKLLCNVNMSNPIQMNKNRA
jgi:ATP-dependent metalloprotease